MEEKEELRRVVPVIEKLVPQVKIPVSIDTTKPVVARAALQAGASIVNDVSANRDNDDLWKIVSDFHAGYICMHAPPPAEQRYPADETIVREVSEFFKSSWSTC